MAETAVGTVDVTVQGANDAPTAAGDAAFVFANTPLRLAVLANDSDPEGDALSIADVLPAAAHGSVIVNADQTLTYTPPVAGSAGATHSSIGARCGRCHCHRYGVAGGRGG